MEGSKLNQNTTMVEAKIDKYEEGIFKFGKATIQFYHISNSDIVNS